MRTNRILSAALVACGAVGLSTSAYATNGYQLIGVGAYQKGMGGAVTANPGSAMTAITNPAGMAAIGKRADFSAEAFMPDRSVDFTGSNAGKRAGGKEESEASMYAVPSIGWTAPVSEGSDIYFGGGMYGTSGLGVDYGGVNFQDAGGNRPANSFDGYSNIQFWQMAPSLAWKVNDQLKVGGSLNLDYQSVSFSQRLTNAAGNAGDMNFQLARPSQEIGFGATLGVLYEINEMVTVGASYRTKQSFSDMEYQLRGTDNTGSGDSDIQHFPDGDGGLVTATGGTYKMDLDYPQQLSAGVKFTPLDRLKVSADIKWINWSDTMDDLEVKGDFQASAADPDPNSSGSSAALDPGWDDQMVYAIGVDYMVTKDLNLRAGYNYAESPIEEDDVFSNLLLPAMTEHHMTLGATYRFNNHWEASFAYMRAFSNSVTGEGDVPQSFQDIGYPEDSEAEIDLEENSYTLNIGYRF